MGRAFQTETGAISEKLKAIREIFESFADRNAY